MVCTGGQPSPWNIKITSSMMFASIPKEKFEVPVQSRNNSANDNEAAFVHGEAFNKDLTLIFKRSKRPLKVDNITIPPVPTGKDMPPPPTETPFYYAAALIDNSILLTGTCLVLSDIHIPQH